MTTTSDRDEVLGAFSVEPEHNLAILKDYLKRYPQFAQDLVELSFLVSNLKEDDAPLSEHDQNRVESACSRIKQPAPVVNSDVLKRLKEHSAEVARSLDIPRQVLTALREGTIDVSTMTRGFISRVAQRLDATFDELREALTGPALNAQRSYRSDRPPRPSKKISLEEALRDANLSDNRIRELMKDDA